MKPDNPAKEERSTSAVTQARKAYQKAYYQAHREKALEYQREYNRTHKKKVKRWRGVSLKAIGREVTRQTFTASDIMHAPTEKVARMLNKVIRGERSLVV